MTGQQAHVSETARRDLPAENARGAEKPADHSSDRTNALEALIEEERIHLLQVFGMLKCLYYEFGDRRASVVVLERIVKLYGISVDQVIGRAPEPTSPRRRLSPKAMRHAERIQGLSRTAQRFVIRIIDALEIQARNGKSGHTQLSHNEAEAPR